MQSKDLSVTRTTDRSRMALLTQELITRCGATFERREGSDYPGPRCIELRVKAPGGVCLNLRFDGDSCQPNVYVLSWHMAMDSKAKLNNATFGGNVNPHHHCKATYVAHGFQNLCSQLERGLRMAEDGSAYLPGTLETTPQAELA